MAHNNINDMTCVSCTRCATCTQLPSSKLRIIFTIILPILSINSPTVNGQQQQLQHYSYLNTPPILYVPDRNWIISEAEQVGQVIARIRAEDAENDDLVFGLEAHFHTNYADPNLNDPTEIKDEKLPFRIDTEKGVVYLNDSLVGRAGEKFFLYITVSDGQLTAKNEVLVNIVAVEREQNRKKNRLPTSNKVQNISQFLPPFSSLPGVQSIRHQFPNIQQQQQHQQQRPINNFPDFLTNPSYTSYPSRPSFMPQATENYEEEDNLNENIDEEILATTTKFQQPLTTTSRTKLMAVTNLHNSHNTSTNEIIKDNLEIEKIAPVSSDYKIKAIVIPIISLCGLIVAIVAITGVIYRRRLFAFGKTLKKKSKEEMAKSSNQSSNLSSSCADDSRNSMVLQHWHGPMAYGNRYVPWERDQQAMATSHLNGNRTGEVGLNASELEGNMEVAGHFGNQKFNRWEFPRHRLKFFNILGEGAFGQVWRCEATNIDGMEGVTTVAVKTLKENATEAEKKDLISELEVMKSLEPNVNVVRLLGCCTEKEPIFVIIEYVNKGKLQTYLRNSRAERHYGNMHGQSNILTSGELTSFMYQVAKGMDYLTSRGIIHRDLAARNILIADDHTCKVADFGFARDVITSKIYERKSEGKLPIRWMAIESLYDNIFSVKSDIWSFGILMWEIVTLGSTPYPGISAADVMRKVREGYRLEKPEHCRRELYNIMFYCWAQDANERPTFSEIVKMLDKLLLTEMDYIELERFPDHNYYNILNLSGEKV